MVAVYLGVGSNQGHREENIANALQLLRENQITILKESSMIETEPIGGPPQGKFLNAVVKIETALSPHDLLIQIKLIEKQLGRVKTIPNGPRPIDLDILIYEGCEIQSEELTIPHPRMLERDFVMLPLNQIAPEIAMAFTRGQVIRRGNHLFPKNPSR